MRQIVLIVKSEKLKIGCSKMTSISDMKDNITKCLTDGVCCLESFGN